MGLNTASRAAETRGNYQENDLNGNYQENDLNQANALRGGTYQTRNLQLPI